MLSFITALDKYYTPIHTIVILLLSILLFILFIPDPGKEELSRYLLWFQHCIILAMLSV